MKVSGKMYGYLLLKGDDRHVKSTLDKIRQNLIPKKKWDDAIRTARYLDFQEQEKS